ncbi:uncharacterized protein BKA55DRAFT_544102 [Fusarium redolens]|uniref:Uncharacterized protein n=1 Tax=Fusarium redolens TaxID=48865 RepID=A0A9P9G8H7_FUSRE|nr:uncharacterized protein BKA55DRAFT_544102 [Fusarium redolens]KAH7234918.1 hypothetical protein BKA55DRAFT_544102 [Fusarium redolens]
MAFASPWESMLAQAGLGGLQFAQAIPALQANAVFAAAGGPFQDLTRRLEIFKQKVAAQDALLHSGVKEHLSMAINRLEVALLQLYKFAVFIRGDINGDDVQKMAILEQCSRSFADCQAASQAGFDQVKSIYTQATSLRTDELQQLQREVERALEQIKMEWENSRRQTEQYQHDIDIWRRQLDEATDALSRANEEREFMGGQMGNPFAWLGPAMGDIGGNMQRVQEARERINTAQYQINNAQHSFMQAMNQQNDLNIQRAASEQIVQQLPVLQVMTEDLNKQAALLLSGFTELKEKSTQLSLLMSDMKNGAKDSDAQSWDKDRFAEGILRLCQMALIDGRVCNEVETITSEISSGYSGQDVPDCVSALLTEVGQAARDVAQKSITG